MDRFILKLILGDPRQSSCVFHAYKTIVLKAKFKNRQLFHTYTFFVLSL
jgi:hypothetical protein